MFWTWCRIELDTNLPVKDTPETFFTMGFGVDISNLHIWSCVHHFKCLVETKLMYIINQVINKPGLGSDPVFQGYFYCFLVILILLLWRYYGVTNWSVEVSIDLVSALELILYVSDSFLAHQSKMEPLNRWSVEVTERLPKISLAWSMSQYGWRKLEYHWYFLISELPALKNHWCGLLFTLKCLFIECMIGSWGWCMRYSMPCMRERKAGSVVAFIQPLIRMVRYCIS